MSVKPGASYSGDTENGSNRQDAPSTIRRASLAQLTEQATKLTSLEERQLCYDKITTPVDETLVDVQIKALKSLTQGGQNLKPFETEIFQFLNRTLSVSYRVAKQVRTNARDIPSYNTTSNDNTVANAETSTKASGGAEDTLVNTIYLVSNAITAHPSAAQIVQLEAFVRIATDIIETTTMYRALRGALNIINAIAAQERLSARDLRSMLGSLCAVIGTTAFDLEEEAWVCVLNASNSDRTSIIFDNILDFLSAPPTISEVREFAKYRGALICTRRILTEREIAIPVAYKTKLLLSGLRKAYGINDTMAYESLRACEGFLSNTACINLLAPESWEEIAGYLYQLDHFHDRQMRQSESCKCCNADITVAPLFQIPDYVEHSASTVLSDESLVITQNIAGRIVSLLDTSPKFLNQSQALIALRILFYLTPFSPSAWSPAMNEAWQQGLLDPQGQSWHAHLGMLGSITGSSPPKPSSAVVSVLQQFQKTFVLLKDDPRKMEIFETHLCQLYRKLSNHLQRNSSVIKATGDLVTSVEPSITLDTLDVILNVLQQSMVTNPEDSDDVAPIKESVPHCLLSLFMSCFQRSHCKTVKIFETMIQLIEAASSVSARIQIMKLLARLRCDSNFGLRLVALPSPESLAANLCNFYTTGARPETTQAAVTPIATHELTEASRIGRSSVVDSDLTARSRSVTRSMNASNRSRHLQAPSWLYDNHVTKPEDLIVPSASHIIQAQSRDEADIRILDLSRWLDLMTRILSQESDWELYSFVLVHIPLQLGNHSLFSNQVKSLQILHNTIVMQLTGGDVREPPKDCGIKKGDVALCLYQILIMLLPYHESFSRRMTEDTIKTFRIGIEKWDRTGKCCIRALALCCYELPVYIEKQVVGITEMMQKRITQSDLAMDILEFLGCLARSKEAYGKAHIDFYRRIFGVCIRYLQYSWEQRQQLLAETAIARNDTKANRQSGNSTDLGRTLTTMQPGDAQGLSAYVYTLAYQTIILWFLSIDVNQRAHHVGWLTQELTWKDVAGDEHIEDQSLVILDMMHRTAFSDLGETKPASKFSDPDIAIVKKMWLVGMSIITTEIAIDASTERAECGQLTKRQASGTTHATYLHNTAELPNHHVREGVDPSQAYPGLALDVYPNHMFLQLTSTIAPTPSPLQPIPLPDDDFTKRALKVFDSTDTVDGHKAGVIYVGEGQTTEAQILANTVGDVAYEAFLDGLGTRVPLRNANFNVQGLDRQSDEDGTHTYAWRDRVTEIVFHIPTLMPTDLRDDPQCDRKKRHVGNDHIKIIFNASGQIYDLDTFSTAMNTINIIITPEAYFAKNHAHTYRTTTQNATAGFAQPAKVDRFGYYIIQTCSSPAYPDISITADAKAVSADALPALVRQIAINASVFCQVWEDGDAEYTSSWRARLQEILKLRKRYANTNTSANVHYPMPGNETATQYVNGDQWTGRITTGGIADADRLLNSLDFTRWT